MEAGVNFVIKLAAKLETRNWVVCVESINNPQSKHIGAKTAPMWPPCAVALVTDLKARFNL